MIVRFDHSDELKASVGRYHTPINYWNTAFHHGQWLQTTITRPEMIQFGGRVLPVHFVGALVEGAIPAAWLNLNYKGGVGNGRGSVISRGGDAGDVNGDLAWLVNGFIKPDRVFGLQAGGAFYDDRVRLQSGAEFDEQIVSAHAVWQKETPEIVFDTLGSGIAIVRPASWPGRRRSTFRWRTGCRSRTRCGSLYSASSTSTSIRWI